MTFACSTCTSNRTRHTARSLVSCSAGFPGRRSRGAIWGGTHSGWLSRSDRPNDGARAQKLHSKQSTATASGTSCSADGALAAEGAGAGADAGAGAAAGANTITAAAIDVVGEAVVEVKLNDTVDVLLGVGMLGSACGNLRSASEVASAPARTEADVSHIRQGKDSSHTVGACLGLRVLGLRTHRCALCLDALKLVRRDSKHRQHGGRQLRSARVRVRVGVRVRVRRLYGRHEELWGQHRRSIRG